ncbi:MAG TPA: NAD(P)/FAD-dependent oxidoreductase [Acidimicrobiales bacterium]|nr:NAD(P)/FAD-dependent oxidoreductase [Acidimicrobiales bacterium]
MTTSQSQRRPQVVIIGSGFGGLLAARGLKGAPVDVTLIARTTHHLFQPLLYQVATGILSSGEVAPATREILKRQRNVTVLLGDVQTIDVDAHTVTSVAPEVTTVTHYDDLILAAGSGQSYFGHDEFAEFAPGLKSIDDALEQRGRIFGAFELAELEQDPAAVQRLMTFVVVGAGPTGVEMAGQIRELSHRTLKGDFRRIDPRAAKIILLDAADRVLPGFSERLSRKTKEKLERLGIDVQLHATVVGVDANGIDVKDADGTRRRIEAVTKIWAAGVQASPLGKQVAEQTGAEVDRAGRVKTLPDLTLPGHPEIFVVGDMAGDGLPGVAQVAMQGGTYAAHRIVDRIEGRPADKPFHYFDKGSMATISRFSAIAQIGNRIQLTGFIAWLAWLFIHLIYLVGFKNRLTTLLHWIISFVGRGRAERAVTIQQVYARTAMRRLGEVEGRSGPEVGHELASDAGYRRPA